MSFYIVFTAASVESAKKILATYTLPQKVMDMIENALDSCGHHHISVTAIGHIANPNFPGDSSCNIDVKTIIFQSPPEHKAEG